MDELSDSDLSSAGLFTDLSDVSPNSPGWSHLERIPERDEMGAAPQPYAEGIAHPPGELEEWSQLLGNTPMPSRRASADQRLSEILGFISRKEPWEIKPADAKLLLVAKLDEVEGGPALQVPSQRYGNRVNKSEPHVFFVGSDRQDAGDIEESREHLQKISTSGADSHTVTKFDDKIAVVRASCSRGEGWKVGQWPLALLPGHPDSESDNFRGLELKEERATGRYKALCRNFGPKLVHSVPDMNKKRKVDASSSSDAPVGGGDLHDDIEDIEDNIIGFVDLAALVPSSKPEDSTLTGNLHVGGSVHIVEKLTVGQDGEGPIHGRLQGHQADHAEWMPRHDPGEVLMPGDVVALTRDADGKRSKVSKRAMGFVDSADVEWVVVPTNPQILGHQPPPGEEHLHVPIVFMGQVPVRVEGSPRASRYLIAV